MDTVSQVAGQVKNINVGKTKPSQLSKVLWLEERFGKILAATAAAQRTLMC